MKRIKEIYERIKKIEYAKGNELFSYNVDNNIETEYEALMDYFYFDCLGWCGCGDPEEAKETIRKFLDAHKDFNDKHKKLKKYFGVENIYDEPLLLCLAYVMDATEFTEHGSSIGGSWLTQNGIDYLYLLEFEKEAEG